MGVSGCGKSTVGLALAQRLGLGFLEGDSLHPPGNIAAMAAGIALDDAMRLPWLQAVATGLHSEQQGIVGSCSALRRSYRDVLRRQGEVFFVHLKIGLHAARARMQERPGHFMNPALAVSQHASLEHLDSDEWGIAVDASHPTEVLVKRVVDHLQTHAAGG
ncbi:MAG: gluconokinase [Pseudotabrizicola sp.]|nr:gluconokinase [Pseudotabrizicola sp.]MDO8884586.1 gluconokinase [Pseudotabrizicola sp.]MDP2083505.1 gluconokinase [Pseudotabrizicola sp.]MDZ7572890.1 gluconokinase [Pseudotabrizicola sp.]